MLFCAVLLAMQTTARPRHLLVKANDAESLLAAIQEANRLNADSNASRLYILIPDGLYDLGERTLTTLSGHNVSIVGQSMTGTIIRNAPAVANEGISKTATLQVRGTGTYLQDLTLKNDLDYFNSGFAGRAVTLHEKNNTHSICKRVRLLSYQDTYYSDSESGQFYFEDSEIHGTVDFICGAGDVYFYHCNIVTEQRTADGKGRCVVAAPRTSKTKWGYIFDRCTVRNAGSPFQFARGWHTQPRCYWLHTTLLTPEKLAAPRFDAKPMRSLDLDFREFHTMDANGQDITPSTNRVTFVLKEESNTLETIMQPQDAPQFTRENVFGTWQPQLLVKTLEKESKKLQGKYLK